MTDLGGLQNLNLHDIIVTPQGTATQFFMRLLQSKNSLVGTINANVTHLENFDIDTSSPILGGPKNLGRDYSITISHADSGVTPGSYSSANITVDEWGHVTAAANGPGSGGSLGAFMAFIDGSDSSDGMVIPGPAGAAGGAGSIGPVGPQGPIGWGMDGNDGEDGMMIPGSPGQGGGGTSGIWAPVVDGSNPPNFILDSSNQLVLTQVA